MQNLNGRDIFVKCKRLNLKNKIEANAKDASSQAQSHLMSRDETARALVSFEITKLFDVDEKIFHYQDESELHAFIAKSINQFIYRNNRKWENVYKRRDPRLIGIMFRLSHLAADEPTKRLITVNNWALLPRVGVSPPDLEILKSLNHSLNAQPQSKKHREFDS